jgi:ribonuclease HI
MMLTETQSQSTTTDEEGRPNTLKIWQQNVNKSPLCQHDIISSGKLAREGIDLVALQEPALYNFEDGNPARTVTSREWTAIFPTTHITNPDKTRSLLLIRADIVTDNWTQIDLNSGDITAVLLRGSWGTLAIFNAYIDCELDQAIDDLTSATRKYQESRGLPQEKVHTLWLGDFNRHHPHWDSTSDIRLFTSEALRKANKLISAVATAGLDLALPPGIPTHKHNVTKKWTRLDQVFISDHTMDSLITCNALRGSPGIRTDHIPILTALNLNIKHTPTKIIKNFREVDWEKFRSELRAKLSQMGQPTPLRDQLSLDTECSNLTKALQETISAQVPTTEISPKSKRWWTKELSKMRRNVNKLGREASKCRGRPWDKIHEEYETAKKQYAKEIESNKRNHWRDWLEKAEDPDIWTANKYTSASNAESFNTRIPTLKTKTGEVETEAISNEDKSKVLAKTFFPSKRTDIETNPAPEEEDAPEPVIEMDPLTIDQVTKHLAKLKPYKAPGPDGIPNVVLTKCADLLADRLLYIYDAMIIREIFYEPWKEFTTVVLRKPGKPKYNVPKAYCPIALINTQMKVLTAILAEQMMYYAETHNLLPKNHFGGRKGRNATDAVHLLVHTIKSAWRKGKVISVLFLDIEGTFLNADNERLIRNLTKRNIPHALITFTANMLKDRRTTLKFDGYISETIILNNGIGQGDPLSMALYQFYNADLLEVPKGTEESAIAYVDDAILTASAEDFHGAHNRIQEMMTRKDGAIEWAEKHNSRFEFSKLALIDFSHHSKKLDRPALTLPNATIEPSSSTKYLGIILDQNLKWKEQLAYVTGKGSTWAAQIRRLARPSWGLTPKAARKLYIGVALPRTLYGLDIWCHPKCATKIGGKRVKPAAHKRLATMQRQGALAITGGYRTSPTDALDAHAALLPMHRRIGKILHTAAVRMASLPREHPLHKPFRYAARRHVKRHRAPLHELAQTLPDDPDNIETIPTVRTNPACSKVAPITVSIPQSKEDSKAADANADEEIKVYSDGSMHGGKVGAAAVLYRNGQRTRSIKLHLGEASKYTVYEAELVGMLLGIHLIKTEKKGRVKCAIGADNQAAIQAIDSELTNPGQHLAAEFLRVADQVALARIGGRQSYELTVRWTAGHIGIEGNESADREAKAAAEGDSSGRFQLPKYLWKPVKMGTSAIKQDYNKRSNEGWKEEWIASDSYKWLKMPNTVSPASKKFLLLTSDDRIPKQKSSLLFQLRVGHAPLNDYLFRFKKVESARCPACGNARESVDHFILKCPKYEHERWPLLRQARDLTPKLEHILSDPKLVIPLLNYIDATERFKVQH